MLIRNPDEVTINSTVAVKDIQSEPYESPQYTLVEQVCEFLKRYAIEYGGGAEIQQSLSSARAASTKNNCA